MVKLRIGVVLWLLSWVPYGIILGLDGAALAAAWTFEVLLGLVGLTLAGTAFAAGVKSHGWKRAPSLTWRTLRYGDAART